jgi:hypothetical protein
MIAHAANIQHWQERDNPPIGGKLVLLEGWISGPAKA